MDEQAINAAIIDSIDDFSYTQSMAAAYVREQLLSPNERKAEERADRIERIVCGIVTALFFAAVWIVEVLA